MNKILQKIIAVKFVLDIIRWIAFIVAGYLLYTHCGWFIAYTGAGFGFYIMSWEPSPKKDALLAILTGPLSWLCFTVQVWMTLRLLESRNESLHDFLEIYRN